MVAPSAKQGNNKMAFQKLVGALLVAAVAGQAAADVIQVGDVVQVADRAGGAFTPTPVPGNSNGLYTSISYTLNGSSRSANAGLYVLDYSHDLAPATTSWNEFLSFCLEPDVALTSFSNPYTAMTLGSAGYNSAAIAELWGRYRSSVVNDTTAAAFQIALWELSYDGGGKNLAAGNFVLNNPASVPYLLASGWLASLDGKGPKAHNLAVLVDNQRDRYDRQDLIVEIPVPATALLMGVGLLGFGLRRRKD